MVVQEGQTAPSDQEVTLLQDQACVGRDLHVENINPYQCIIKDILVKRGILPLEVVNTPAIAGRLALYLKNWQSVTQDHWVLNAVQGYRIEFLSEPFQRSRPRAGVTSPSEQSLRIEEVQKLQSKGAVAELALTEADRGFYSSLFLVPKKDGGMRPVINLKGLNKFVAPQHFKMEGLHTLKDLLRRYDWMTKLDLKDAFFMIPIHSSSRPALRFSVQNRLYQFTCLPFGLSCAPWVFTKTLKPALTLLRELGVRLVAYIDDILVMAETEEKSRDHTEGLVYLLENLGFMIHPEKKITTPTQEIEFLGIVADSC